MFIMANAISAIFHQVIVNFICVEFVKSNNEMQDKN